MKFSQNVMNSVKVNVKNPFSSVQNIIYSKSSFLNSRAFTFILHVKSQYRDKNGSFFTNLKLKDVLQSYEK